METTIKNQSGHLRKNEVTKKTYNTIIIIGKNIKREHYELEVSNVLLQILTEQENDSK